MVVLRRQGQGEFVFIIRFTVLIATMLVLGIFWSVARDDYYSDYSLLNWAPPKRLELVHIARTGGTHIAHEALKYGHSWGVCHFGDSCPGQRNRWTANTPSYHHCPWHHVPSQYLDSLLPESQNPYHGADRFVVVRNVYDRLISEYYSQHPDAESTQTVTDFNEWVRQALNVLTRFKRGDMSRKEIGNQEYFTQLGHLIPQYDYVYENGQRVVQHVVHYENMPIEFNKLMVEYQLPMRMSLSHPHKARALTAHNLTKVNLIGIEMIYEDDFREWDYEIMSSNLPDEDMSQTQSALAKEHNNYVPAPPKPPIPVHWIRKGQNTTGVAALPRLRGGRKRNS